MSDPRIELINALAILLKADSSVTDVVKAENIVKIAPEDGFEGEVRPRINLVPGDLERINEYGAERLYLADVHFFMTVDNNENDLSTIFEVIDVVVGNGDAFIYKNDSSITGIPAGDSAKIIDDGNVIQVRPVYDTDNRIVTADLLVQYSYHQVKT